MSTDKIKTRPYWHVDAKWITGLLLISCLSLTLVFFLLAQITSEDQGIDLLTLALASSYSPAGMDDGTDIEIMQQEITESPGGAWQPIPGLTIVVREEDIAGKTPREARLWFFRQMAEPLYFGGAEGLAGIATDAEIQKNLEGGIGPLGLISAESHRKLQGVLTIVGLASLVLLGLLILFSYRFGKLGSPGCVFFLTAVPGLLLMGGINGWLSQNTEQSAAIGEPTLFTRFAQLAKDVLPVIVQKAMQINVLLILLGVGLMLVALIGTVFVRERKK